MSTFQPSAKSRFRRLRRLVLVLGSVMVLGVMLRLLDLHSAQPAAALSLSLADASSFSTVIEPLSALRAEESCTFDQSLMLINAQYRLPDDFSPELCEIGDSGVWVNCCYADAYTAAKNAVREKFDNALYIMSAYRSAEEQAETKKQEGDTAAAVGASEHQAGLAADVYVPYYAGMGFLNCPEGKFIQENCWRYGLIVRYPAYGEKQTGIAYEPWHLRYVGFPHAEIIMQQRITLETYLSSLVPGNFYVYGSFLISRQPIGETLTVPVSYRTMTISPDNMGYYILTCAMDAS